MRYYSWISEKLEVRKNESLGEDGLFATSNIIKDERLIVFGGYVMTLDEEANLPSKISDFAHQIDDDLVIGVRDLEKIQPADKVNHSCSPNSGFKGQILLVAMSDIQRGEEITFDYAMVLSDEKGLPYSMECSCDSPQCRKIISSSDWKNSELQKKYSGYFQYYIEQKIKNMKTI
ncbi:MAG: SET domain-containing protein [Candidatus Pacebacteria bacterium]|nr:SET domain-containing protein [Candidatus Paceibacterota bacterium]MBP9843055.1 SET domain-containing protein [Candidatus Paceibacterota bacterium]